MATTSTTICNLALSLIGDEGLQLSAADVIASDTDNTKASRQCALHYPIALDEVIRMHTWNCTIKRDELTTSAYTEHGWTYKATLPTDCVRPIRMDSEDSDDKTVVVNVPWAIEGRTILTNSSDCFLIYQAAPTIATMDSLFMRTFYYTLASKIAIPLTGDRQIRADIINEIENIILPEARRVNSFEGYQHAMMDSEWIEATMTSSSGSYPPFGAATWVTTFPWS